MENNRIIAAMHDPQAREDYLADHRSFVQRVASKFCRRVLSWDRDDELSVAFIAFNEAMNVYDPEKGVPFLAFTRRVIQNRLTDFMRRENRHKHASLEPVKAEEREITSEGEILAAWANYNRERVEQERGEEILQYQDSLAKFGLSFDDLVRVSPKHRDTRETLMRAAVVLCDDREMRASLLRKKQLPLKELALASGIHIKTLERGRKYIVAVALIISAGEEFLHLRGYIKFPEKGGRG